MTPLNSSCLFNISNWTSNKLLECAVSRIQFLITPSHLLLPQSSSQKQVHLLPSRCLNQNPRSHFSLFLMPHIPSIRESYWRPLEDTFGIRLLLPYHYGLSPHHLNYRKSSNWPLCFLSFRPCFCYCLVAKLLQTLKPHGLKHIRLPCPSPSPGICLDSWPLSW